MHSEICPVCKGRGKVPNTDWTKSERMLESCPGCNGRGWVEVKDGPDCTPILPYYVPPQPVEPWGIPWSEPYPGPYYPGRVIWTDGNETQDATTDKIWKDVVWY